MVNNAGFAFKMAATEPFAQQAEITVGVNFYGTLKVTESLFPLMRDGGSIINVGSRAGSLQSWSSALRTRLLNAGSLEEVKAVGDEFVAAAKNGSDASKALGFPSTTYGVSKALLHAMTRVHAREHPRLKINAMCPGCVP